MISVNSIKKIAILGVGMMGGSLALSLKEKFPHFSICGYARSGKSYRRLKKIGILDQVEKNIEKVVRNADLVILASPIYSIINYLKIISPFLKRGTIIFDLGSSKKLIHNAARKYLPEYVNFVGCHPLCGSEKSGAHFSRSDLYQGAICLITSSPHGPSAKIVKKIWEKVGSKVLFVDVSLHDKILSSVSHFPHLVSFSLTQFVPQNYLNFSSGSLRDLTRISNSPAEVWADIFLSNRENILGDLKKFITVLSKFKSLLEEGRREKIVTAIRKVNTKQRHIL
jgi:prephenate dehydrogenase